jgi:hypothetical protein
LLGEEEEEEEEVLRLWYEGKQKEIGCGVSSRNETRSQRESFYKTLGGRKWGRSSRLADKVLRAHHSSISILERTRLYDPFSPSLPFIFLPLSKCDQHEGRFFIFFFFLISIQQGYSGMELDQEEEEEEEERERDGIDNAYAMVCRVYYFFFCC